MRKKKTVKAELQEVKKAFANIAQNSGDDILPLARMLTNQLIKIQYSNDTGCSDKQFNLQHAENILDTMRNINPADHVEAMLATQMFAMHNAIMKNFALAVSFIDSTDVKTIEVTNLRFNMVNKLTRTYAMQTEALARHRTKGQQKIIVEHLQINSGGQAIIGNVTKTNLTIEEAQKEKEGGNF